MASGRRVLCMRRCTRTTSKQLAERLAKGRVHYLSRPRLSRPRTMSQLDNDGNCLKSQTRDWSIWHELTIHRIENDKMARLGENDGFQWRKGWRK